METTMRQLTRRGMLGTMAALTATAAVGAVSPATAAAVAPVPDPSLDDSHATAEVSRLVTGMYRDKTSRSADRTMTHFAHNPVFYTDAILGSYASDWDVMKATFAQYMANWPDTARTYPTRIIGDERSAMVLFTDSPELFGHEIRVIAPFDFRDGLIVRQVDYWDGRHFGIDATNRLRVPADQFPTTFGEDVVHDQSSPVLRNAATRLNAALGSGDVTGLFTTDAIFEDLTLRTRLVGALAIDAYVKRAYAGLPYGRGTTIRHTVGSHQGGGYEWINQGSAVNHGVIAIELDPNQQISRLTSTWDGSLVDDAAMTTLLVATLER
jgi:hypothetical protein